MLMETYLVSKSSDARACAREDAPDLDANGSSREIAAYLGDVSHFTVQKKLAPSLFAAFADSYRTIRALRGKVF